ncbi:MAG: hypothetical protein K2X02_08260 [Alphaproteobacteria bacterium]|nr:hypothetical protein [Alphaproteobacteria bacterium]
MKFLTKSSFIIGTIFLLGASTVSNAIDTQPLVKSSDSSNIIKVRGGGRIGGGGFGHMGGGFSHHGGDFARHGGDFAHHRGWNNDVGVGVGVGIGGPGYYGAPDVDVFDTGPADVCVGPYCPVPEY